MSCVVQIQVVIGFLVFHTLQAPNTQVLACVSCSLLKLSSVCIMLNASRYAHFLFYLVVLHQTSTSQGQDLIFGIDKVHFLSMKCFEESELDSFLSSRIKFDQVIYLQIAMTQSPTFLLLQLLVCSFKHNGYNNVSLKVLIRNLQICFVSKTLSSQLTPNQHLNSKCLHHPKHLKVRDLFFYLYLISLQVEVKIEFLGFRLRFLLSKYINKKILQLVQVCSSLNKVSSLKCSRKH